MKICLFLFTYVWHYVNILVTHKKELLILFQFVEDIPTKQGFKELAKEKGAKTILAFPISHEEVVLNDTLKAEQFFANIVGGKSKLRGTVMLTISGYDTDPRELFEIEEVCTFCKKLVKAVPHMIYYLEQKETFAWFLNCIASDIELLTPRNNLTAEEVFQRRMKGQPIPEIGTRVWVSEDIVNAVNSESKKLGAEINDLKGVYEFLARFNSKAHVK